MMKKLGAVALCTMVALGALISGVRMPVALAQENMVLLAELKEQVPDVWSGSFAGKDGKVVEFEAPVLMPEADVFPLLKVERKSPDENALAAYGDLVTMKNPYMPSFWNAYFEEDWKLPNADRVYHNIWATNAEIAPYAIYAENQSQSVGEVADKLAAIVKRLYGDEVGVILDVAKTWPPVEMSAKKGGGYAPVPDASGMGGYELTGITTLRGVPMLGGPKFRQGYSGRAENILDYWFNCDIPIYYSDAFYGARISAWQTVQEVQSDLPLCAFETVQATIEGLIEKGKLHDVMAVYLGYVVWLDPEVEYIAKPASKNWDEALAKPCIATPVWVVECQYSSNSGKSLDDYPEFEGTEVFDYRKHMWGHNMLMIDAQTGKAYDSWDTSHDRAYAPKVLTWDDVK